MAGFTPTLFSTATSSGSPSVFAKPIQEAVTRKRAASKKKASPKKGIAKPAVKK